VLNFSADPTLPGNKVWMIDDYGSGTPRVNQIVVYTDTLVVTTPTPVSPKDGVLIQVNSETGIAYNTTLSWIEPSLAFVYQVQISYDSAFTNLYDDFVWFDVSKTPYLVVGPLTGADEPINYQPGETWYWRVRAIVPFYSPWTQAFSVTIQPIAAPVPTLYSPANGGVVSTLTPGFSWSPMGAAASYHFQIATDAAFTHIIQDSNVDANGVDGAGVQLTAPLVDGKQYFWHVQVIAPVEGDWSTVVNFMVSKAAAPSPQVTITQAGPTTIGLTATQPPATSITVASTHEDNVVNPSYIWAIIIIGVVLVIAIMVLIFRTKKP
ncbi:MAG: hypothetical protein ACYDG5_04910, partial [Dehalococcoidales bacterium]